MLFGINSASVLFQRIIVQNSQGFQIIEAKVDHFVI